MPDLPSFPALPFSSSHIADIFGQRTFVRGLEYKSKGAVVKLDVDFDERTLRGAVQGTRDLPYQVRVSTNEKGLINNTSCSCPVGSYCKHAVALILEAGSIHGFTEFVSTGPMELPRSVQHWVDEIKGSISAHAEKAEKISAESVIYIIDKSRFGNIPSIVLTPYLVGKKNSAGLQKVVETSFEDLSPELGATKDDESIAQFALAALSSAYLGDVLSGDPELVKMLLDKLVATGRTYFRSASNSPLTKGPRVEGKVKWVFRRDRSQVPAIVADKATIVPLMSACPAYVDTYMNHIGFMDLPADVETIAKLLIAPPVMPGFADKVYDQLKDLALPPEIELPCPMLDEEIVKNEPTPQISFKSILPIGNEALLYWRRGLEPNKGINVVDLSFDYDGHTFDLRDKNSEFREAKGPNSVVYRRDLSSERKAAQKLKDLGFEPLPMHSESTRMRFILKDDCDYRWLHFVENELPRLLKTEWKVDVDETFTYRVVKPEEALEFELKEQTAWWFVLELGVTHEGKRISLFPIIISALKRAGASNLKDLDIQSLNINGYFYAPMGDGRLIALPFDRVESVIDLIREMYNADLKEATVEAERLPAILSHIKVMPTERIKKLAKHLEKLDRIEPIETPEDFGAELRQYQKEGLGWLNFLSDMDAGGILADDMGLGKTVQGLAHILLRKQKGLLTQPALVVCPTSVVPNWMNEAERLTPTLKVLRLTGSDRMERFREIPQADIVVTSYALLLRDAESLAISDWSMIILDESQYIKNPTTSVSKAASRLRARARFCFTGTPVENNLRELWSQFNFLMPNMLGNRKSFASFFQKPIERNDNQERKRMLQRRIRPFMLRRTKSEVVQELPPKTLILHPIELIGEQRDLYESVRLAMHKRVNEEIRDKGIPGMRILIIDALLKLRQTCCDPRLVKLKMAEGITDSAKLLTLMDMLPQLAEEGRRIIVFSQFRKMLELIEVELQREKLDYVMLTGVTKDRQTAINKFQRGDVPIFLISLKAGGTGLNLTAADTVIHYDPWWNPAVEDQATDRAYRIGQDKPVFVYKFIARGSVEERIVVMQEHKKGLAGGIFTEGQAASLAVNQEEIDFLLQPLDMPDPRFSRRRKPPHLYIVE
ncbi:MAG: SWIM zinc finger family protein [Candidatus Melainabacteria bacterium]|nr:SWIM zinc finger family protein [Candidatus Melainabacteria bacterium]